MTWIDNRRAELGKLTKEQLVAHVVNKTVNDLIGGYADYEAGEQDPYGHGKRVPYIGWYWRNVDFVNADFTIGDCGDFRGFMENNKWGYPQRNLTPVEAAQVVGVVCDAMRLDGQGGNLAEIVAETKAKAAEL